MQLNSGPWEERLGETGEGRWLRGRARGQREGRSRKPERTHPSYPCHPAGPCSPPAARPAAASRGLGSPCSPRSPPPGRPQSFLQAQGDGRPTLPGPRARCFAFASFTPISPSYPDSLALPPESFPWPPALSGRCQPHLRAERSSFLAASRFATPPSAFAVHAGLCGLAPTPPRATTSFALLSVVPPTHGSISML